MGRIITVTTDFGLNDYFVGVMKGVILSINPDVCIVDINNNIRRHDIMQGAFSISSSFRYFPSGTIHLVVVDPGVGSRRRAIVVSCEGHYFIGPDNGVFTFLFQESNDYQIYEITNSSFMCDSISFTFHGRDIFAPVSAHLSLGKPISAVGKEVFDPVMLDINPPIITENRIIGEVIYVDTFGNLITNIKADLISEGCDVVVSGLKVGTIKDSYSSVKEGEVVALIGSSGYLEIAVNKGSAKEYFSSTKPVVEVIKS